MRACRFCTADGRVLFQILSPYVDIFHQALTRMSSPLLDGVLGTQGEHCHVFQGQAEAAEASMKLLGETLPHLVALILDRTGQDKETTEEEESGENMKQEQIKRLMRNGSERGKQIKTYNS